jgi:hypothetical protein
MPTKNEKIISRMYFIEPAVWRIGADFVVAVGNEHEPKIPVAYYRIENYDENKKPMFSSRDLEGNELFETTTYLFQLKRKFRDKEIELTQAMLDQQIGVEDSEVTLDKKNRMHEINGLRDDTANAHKQEMER